MNDLEDILISNFVGTFTRILITAGYTVTTRLEHNPALRAADTMTLFSRAWRLVGNPEGEPGKIVAVEHAISLFELRHIKTPVRTVAEIKARQLLAELEAGR